MTTQRLSLAAWQQGRRDICARFAAAGKDEERLLALARELVDWEDLRPTSNLRHLQHALAVRFDGFDFVHDLNHDVLITLTPPQVARLLWCLERASIQVWRSYAPGRSREEEGP